ncbi:MAG: hypothetical protein Q8O42_07465 [Acidobacteriota bacterium]|nr:hypothetical protein [Acidobacteriota bacterium]
MAKQTSSKVPSTKPIAPGPDRADTFKTIAARVRLIGGRRSPAWRALYNEAAAILEKEVRKHGSTPKN